MWAGGGGGTKGGGGAYSLHRFVKLLIATSNEPYVWEEIVRAGKIML